LLAYGVSPVALAALEARHALDAGRLLAELIELRPD
jgi:hypothetical protein